MNYSIVRQKFGTSKFEKIHSFDLNYSIVDLCYVSERGFFFICKDTHCIGLIENNGTLIFPWVGSINTNGSNEGSGVHARFNMPSSLSYFESGKKIFVIDNCGRSVREINVENRYASNSYGKKPIKDFKRITGKEFVRTASTNNEFGHVYWSIFSLNKIFEMTDASVYRLAGDGRQRYASSNRLNKCSFNNPDGISYIDDAIYVCDSGNRCIRQIKNGLSRIMIGTPSDDSSITCPSNIKIKNGIGYFLDDGKVKYFSYNPTSDGEIYKSEKIVDIEIDDSKNLYVLEVGK